MKNLSRDTLVSTMTLEQLQQALAMQTQTMQPVVGIDEACEITGYKKSTIYSLVHKRIIPHFKRGKRVLFNRSELADWLQENRIEPVSEFVDKVMNR